MESQSTPTDTTLVTCAKKGDRESFGQLIEAHTLRAYRIAYSILQNQCDAEDAVQDAFITAYKSLPKLEKEESFGSWLGRIVTTRAYDILRKKQKQGKTTEASISQFKMDLSHSIANPGEASQDFDLDFREAVTKLPEMHRLVIMLRYSEDATADEIAATLNRPAGTIRRILSESYGMLRLYLQKEETHEV